MSHQIENQYRFILESKKRVTINYQVDFSGPDAPKIVFDGYPFTDTSNQLNSFIGFCLNLSSSPATPFGPNPYSDPADPNNRTANIKFKIPCVGYFNNNNVLPEFFIKHFKPLPQDSAFNANRYTIESTLDMESNLYVNCNLNVYNDITAFATYHSSDINLKKDINTLENCYDIVSNLNPVGFKWIKDNKDNVGFIAQEIEQIIPSIVSDNDEYKVLAETKIIAYLVGAIQELDKELKELEKE